MVSASAEVSIPRFDERLVVGTVAEVIRKWQALTFDTDGVLIHDCARIEGLRLLRGRHHQKDAQYRVVSTPKETTADETPAPIVLTLLAAGHDKLAFQVGLDELGSASFAIENPARPGKLTGSLETELGDDGGRFMRGPMCVGAAVDLTAIPSKSPRSAQAVAQLEHRRATASAEVSIAQPNSREWVVRVTAKVRGGGFLRPIVGIASPFIRGLFRRELQKSMDKLPLWIAEQKFGTPTPTELAERGFDEFIAGLARVVPSDALS